MVGRIFLALIVVAVVTSRADAQPAAAPQVEPPAPQVEPPPAPQVEPPPASQVEPPPATQVEPPPAATIPLVPPSMVAPRDPASSPPAARSQWYGWQILISDAAVLGFAGLSGKAGVAYGWIGGGAIVHFGHGNVGRGLASAALRVGLPLAGLYLGVASTSGCKGDWCGFGDAIVGGVIGMASAELIDVALLARDTAPPSAAVRPVQPSHGVEVSPVVRAGRSGIGLDLVGRF